MLPLHGFRSYIRQHSLFEPGDKILLAVSGGKDSVLMTHLFNEAKLSFGIAHCNFGLRGKDSDNDEQFTEELAKQVGAPFYSTQFNTLHHAGENGISVQMAARDLRYAWFEEIRRNFGYDVIALAQHKSDSAETILLNLVRGTGISGLHGILPVRGKLVRPLLFLNGDEIETLVKENAIRYREDLSNLSVKYARNKIRHQVIPVLKELNPSLEKTFEKNSKHFAQVEEFFTDYVNTLRNSLFVPFDTGFQLAIHQLEILHPLPLLLFELFRPFHFSEQTLADLAGTWKGQAGKTFYSPTHLLVVDRNSLILSALNASSSSLTTEIFENDSEVSWNGYTIIQQAGTPKQLKNNIGSSFAHVDAEKLSYPLLLRCWQQSDYFYPLGMRGKKKISDFFISLKIPVHLKASIPLLLNGNGEIIWVAGYRINDRYKLKPDTEKVAIFEIRKS